jgi:hypothetical protein
MTPPAGEPAPRSEAVPVPAGAQPRCRRCRMPVRADEREVYFLRLGLCYWCAHVDAQG